MPSTVVARFHYDAIEHSLRITFVSGLVYEYKDVPENIYEALRSAKSKGSYLNHHIKGHYKFVRVK